MLAKALQNESQNSIYRKAVLSNGLTIVGETHSYVRSVSVGLWVKVGSLVESSSAHGASHFIEHLVFKGTRKRTALEIATVLESRGGDLNAFTDKEATCFHATVLKEDLGLALDVLSDLVTAPLFDKAHLEKERKVLLRELSMSEESPEEYINDLFFRSVWRGHPIGQSVIGTKASIQALSRQKVLQHFEAYYRPDNMVLSVAGNFDFDEVVKSCEQLFQFQSLQKQLPIQLPRPKFHARHQHSKLDSDQFHVLIGFESVGFREEGRFEALILSFFLGGGMSSRLFQEIRERAALAYNVECDYIPFADTGLFQFYATLSPRSVSAFLEILQREVKQVCEVPLTKEELEIVKGQLKGTILLSADHMDTRQESLGRNEVVFGRYISVEEVIGEIAKVQPEGIQKLACQMFTRAREGLVTMARSRPRKQRLSLFEV